MILSHHQIEDIGAAVIQDFNKFFYCGSAALGDKYVRATPIDQFARDYLGLSVRFARLSVDGSICGLTSYADAEYIIEEMGTVRTIELKQNQILLDSSFLEAGKVKKLCGKRRFTLAHECSTTNLVSNGVRGVPAKMPRILFGAAVLLPPRLEK